jgi:uncharacterized integral membrane protein
MFRVLAALLLVGTTIFALSNPDRILLRFLAWGVETTVALAVLGSALLGGFMIWLATMAGQRRLRAQVRDLQGRLRAAEAPPTTASPAAPTSSPGR